MRSWAALTWFLNSLDPRVTGRKMKRGVSYPVRIALPRTFFSRSPLSTGGPRRFEVSPENEENFSMNMKIVMDEFLSQTPRLTGNFVKGMIDAMIEGAKQTMARAKRGKFRILQSGLGLEVLAVPNLRVLLHILEATLDTELLWFVLRLGIGNVALGVGRPGALSARRNGAPKGAGALRG